MIQWKLPSGVIRASSSLALEAEARASMEARRQGRARSEVCWLRVLLRSESQEADMAEEERTKSSCLSWEASRFRTAEFWAACSGVLPGAEG